MSTELKDVADAIEEAENPERPVLLDSRGAPTRRPIGKRGDWITRGDADMMVRNAVMAERVENEKMVKWYMVQIPELVAKMIGDVMALNGLVMQAPDDTAGHTAEGATPASDAQHAGQTEGTESGDEAAPEFKEKSDEGGFLGGVTV